MANVNKVIQIGRLTRDPETRTFANGGKVCQFGFATNNRKKNPSTGAWEDDPMFIDCKVFNRGESGQQADLVQQNLHKGSQVFLEGHLVLEQWDDKNGGGKRSKHVLVVDNFQYLEPRAQGQDEAPSHPRQARPQATGARTYQPRGTPLARPQDAGDSFEPPAPDGDGGEIPF